MDWWLVARGGCDPLSSSFRTGSSITNRAPRGCRLAAAMRPPAASTIERVMESPRPRLRPDFPAWVVKPGSNTLSTRAGGMPPPESSTERTTERTAPGGRAVRSGKVQWRPAPAIDSGRFDQVYQGPDEVFAGHRNRPGPPSAAAVTVIAGPAIAASRLRKASNSSRMSVTPVSAATGSGRSSKRRP